MEVVIWSTFLFMFLVFSFKIFFVSFVLRDLFSFICFLKPFPRIFCSLSVSIWPWFFSPMHWFNQDTTSCKQEIFSEDALGKLSFQRLFFPMSVIHSPALLSADKFSITGEKGELRKLLILFSFLLVLYILFIFTCISL